ncbi:hypothetical protein BJ944DRAFT_252529 [Cunninghamella echinulata]|nr:hypothetical protein BJ944DRAFT_252529 [Cunninghamella echinulata]
MFMISLIIPTLYQTKYLILAFGFQDENKPSDSINVIDVTNPFYPVFLPTSIQNPLPTSSTLSTPTSTNTNNNENGVFSGDTLKKTIISISVIAVIKKKTKTGTRNYTRRRIANDR